MPKFRPVFTSDVSARLPVDMPIISTDDRKAMIAEMRAREEAEEAAKKEKRRAIPRDAAPVSQRVRTEEQRINALRTRISRFAEHGEVPAKYGLHPDEYKKLAKDQNYRCAICLEIPRMLVVDHCHDTGRIRGMLCSSCNYGLGVYSDDAHRMQAAASYLAKSKEPDVNAKYAPNFYPMVIVWKDGKKVLAEDDNLMFTHSPL